MRLIDLGQKLSPLALAAILPLALPACGDDITGTSDTETNDDDDSSTSDTPTTMTTTMSTTMTTTVSSSTTDASTTTGQDTDSDTEPDTDTDDPSLGDSSSSSSTDPQTSSSSSSDGSSSSSSSSSGDPAECGNGVAEDGEDCDGDDLADAACPVLGAVACNDDCTVDMSACTDTMSFCSTPASAIDDTTTTMAPLQDLINVPDSFFVTDVDIPVDISHTWVSDMDIDLIAPDAAVEVRLHDGQCGGGPDDIDAVYDDEGLEVVCANAPAISGSVLAFGDLRHMVGVQSMGDWTLQIADTFSSLDDGVLNEWCVELTLSADDPVMCGDDVANFGEECDGADLNEVLCENVEGFVGGTIACADDCTFDTSMCLEAGCNGQVIDGEEVCDGDNLSEETCESQGFSSGGGMLGCAEDCSDYDTSACIPIACGDDLAEGDEACDGDDLGGNTCESLGFDSGDLSCDEDCAAFDTSACIGGQPLWGDDFEEDTDLEPIGPEWVFGAEAGWIATTAQAQAGLQSAQSGLPFGANSQEAEASVEVNFAAAGTVTFQYRTSSENNFDFLRFFVDGAQQGSWSGINDWTEASFDVTAGTHTLMWQYDKDGSVSSGEDTVWVDEIVTTGTLAPPAP